MFSFKHGATLVIGVALVMPASINSQMNDEPYKVQVGHTTQAAERSTSPPMPAALYIKQDVPPTKSEGSTPPPAQPEKRTPPKTVAGLNEIQTAHAVVIIETSIEEGVGERGAVVAVSTALQESTLQNHANVNVGESFNYPHDKVGDDHDSVGLFQQRPGPDYKWCDKVQDCMDPKESTKSFLKELKQIEDWQEMPVTVAAQTVQDSDYPGNYADDQELAEEIVDELM